MQLRSTPKPSPSTIYTGEQFVPRVGFVCRLQWEEGFVFFFCEEAFAGGKGGKGDGCFADWEFACWRG